MTIRIFAAVAPLLLSACLSGPPASVLPEISPADPVAAIAPIERYNYFTGYEDRRPVEPAPWRRRNENVAPRGSQ